MSDSKIKKNVRDAYSDIAKGIKRSCCGDSSCCLYGGSSKALGYSDGDLKAVPEGADLGLGCGNPVALASLKDGEIVIDLGSGAGFDSFIASQRVGITGKVIGIDMTPEMVEKARENQGKDDFGNIEFRLGEIENLPAEDNIADVVISNCVINLSTDKPRVFSEIFRVLKPGGRMMVSDIVLLKSLPPGVKNSIAAYVGCIAGASLKEEYINIIKFAGFKEVEIIDEAPFPTANLLGQLINEDYSLSYDMLKQVEASLVSIKVKGLKE